MEESHIFQVESNLLSQYEGHIMLWPHDTHHVYQAQSKAVGTHPCVGVAELVQELHAYWIVNSES